MLYPAHVDTVRRIGAVITLAAAVVSCGSDEADSVPPGVLLLVESDLTGTTAGQAFAAVPELLVTVDGTVMYGAPEGLAIQGELLPDLWVHTLSPGGVEFVRQSVEDGSAPTRLGDLLVLVGSELGPTQFYLPDSYRFRAVEVGLASDFDDPDTQIIEWPDTVSVALADAAECVSLPEIEVGEVLETAAADSVFVDDGVVYTVVAAQDWPGAPC